MRGQDDPTKYFLGGDITLSSANITINSGYVVLCLNGNILTGTSSGSVITISSGANFTLCDCNTTTEHGYYVSSSIYKFDNDSEPTGTIYGGVITGGNSSSSGGGVYVRGTFNMYGGTIAGNYVVDYGGA